MTVPSLLTALGPFLLVCMALALQAKGQRDEGTEGEQGWPRLRAAF